MKKTLVSLALASLVASAFANTSFYSSKDETSSANLYVNGYARVNFDLTKSNSKVLESVWSSSDKYDQKHLNTKLRFELGGDFTASDLTFGFNARTEYQRNNTSKKTIVQPADLSNLVVSDGMIIVDEGSLQPKTTINNPTYAPSELSVDGLNLTRYYGYVGSAKFGKLVVGKTTTLIDNKFGDDTFVLPTFGTAVTARSFAPLSVNYTYNFNPVSVSLGYSKNNKETEYQFQFRQYAVQLAADLAGNQLQLIYANETGKYYGSLLVYSKNKSSTSDSNYYISRPSNYKLYVTNSVDFTLSNSKLVDDLTLGLGLGYEVKQKYSEYANEEASGTSEEVQNAVNSLKVTPSKSYKEKRFSASAKATYTGNQYFSPYVGYSFVKEDVKFGSEKYSATKTHYAYLGASSKVWNQDSLALELFAEAGLKYANKKEYIYTTEKNNDIVMTKKTKDKNAVYAVGAKFSF